ncbi:FMR1 neighbor protein [Cuculus canorus]|uniref:FMR1 neighbor protein n=1 Tax=Cuculus canorus TaxID=55661 RepID=UPI0023AA97C6|nr:FMR1 neighbor protein [Cuculus canorus]
MLLIGTHVAWNYMVLILLYCINSSFAPPTQHVLVKSELTPRNFYMKLKDAYETLLNFFRPMTCRHRDGQTLIPCDVGEGHNATECLENKCCPSKTPREPQCYMPFKDNLQLIFRVLLLVAGGLLILGCLPLCGCACLQRSPCVNPLQKASIKVKQTVQKKKVHSDDTYAPLLDSLEKDS